MVKFTSIVSFLVTLFTLTAQANELQDRLWSSLAFQSVKVKEAAFRLQAEGREVEEQEMLTINLGLLNGWVAKVPNYNERSEVFVEALDNHVRNYSSAVIFIQEIWYPRDREKLAAWATKNGYYSVNSEIKALMPTNSGRGTPQFLEKLKKLKHLFVHPNRTGLEILIRKSIVDEIKFVGFLEYEGVDRAIFEVAAFADVGSNMVRGSASDVMRGCLSAVVKLKSGKTVSLFTSHLTPGIDYNAQREAQLVALRKNINAKNKEFNVDLVFAGVDLNLSPNWKNSTGGQMDGDAEKWDENSLNYLKFGLESGLIDSYGVAHFDWNSLEVPQGFTQDRIENTLTAESASTKSEPEQRIDYIYIGAPTFKKQKFNVVRSNLVFVEPLKNGIFLTDHFGVSSTFQF
jgi:hypothetical protein